MAIIQSGISSTLWTIDTTSNAGRVTVYNQNGIAMGSVSSLSNILNALNSTVTIVLGGQATLGLNVTGTVGTLTLSFEASMDNIAWFPISATAISGAVIITSTNSDGYWVASTSGFYAIRARVSAYTSGSMNVSVTLTPSISQNISQSVTGVLTTNIGTTGGLALDTTLTGGTSKFLMYDGTNTIGTSAHPIKIDPTGSTTQPVSGTITANAGTGTFAVSASSLPLPTGAATETTLSSRLSDSTFTSRINTQGQKAMAASTPVVIASDQSSFPITGSGNFTVVQPTASNLNANVSGTVTANAGTGNFTVTQATAANLNATVTGTVISNIGTTNGLSLDSTLTGGSQTTRITDGINTSTVKAASTAAIATDKALVVAISPNNSVAVTGTFFQGTQPISGTITANAGTGNFTVVQATAANLNATVIGIVTANIGTTNGIALDATISGLQVSQSSATSGQKGELILGAVTTAAPTYTTAQSSPISITTAGAVRIDGSGSTQPVSGTVATTQSGTWTIQPGNTANTTPWLATINQGGNSATVSVGGALKIDGSATTQPVSGIITANAGTGNFTVVQATAANLNATVTGTVTSNIGTTNGLALDTSVNGIIVAQGSATSGEKGALIQGAVTTAAPAYTTAQTSPLSLTTAGALRIDGSATTQPISGTVTANAGTGNFTVAQATAANLNATVTGTVAATQSGTWTIQPGNTANTTPWLSTINQGGNSATVSVGGALKVDGSAATQPVSGNVTSNQGTANTLANGWPVEITDGISIIGTQTHPLIIDFVGDTSPATQNITAQDVGSVTTAAANGQSFITGSATAGSTALFSVSTDETVKIMVSGVWTGTLTTEISVDSGTTWVASDVHQTGSPYTTNSFTGNFIGGLNVSGNTNFRVRATAAWTGTATIRIIISDQVNSIYVASPTLLRDGIIQSNLNTIKSANTQSTAADTALVVALSPASAQTRSSTATVTQVASSATSVTLLAANVNRLGAMIINDSTQILFVKFGSGSSSTSYTTVVPISRGLFEIPFGYTGIISGNWVSANGNAYVTELTI